jgi:hypothetical protein
MSSGSEKDQASSVVEVIRKVEGLLRSGQVDQSVSASSPSVEAKVKELRQAEIIDPQTLRLTVTL